MAHILMADDDVAGRDVLRRAIESDGHTVTAASDGQDALDLVMAGQGRFAILVSDVQMPGLDGIAMAQRALAAYPALKVILLSGFADGLARADALPATVRRLAKPVAIDVLRREIRALLAS